MNSPFPDTKAQPDSDWLDQVLREDARTHIDDAGFTDAVLRKLPAHRLTSFKWHRWLPAILAAGGTLVAVGILPGSDVFLDGAADLVTADISSPRVVAMIGTLVVFLGIAFALASGER